MKGYNQCKGKCLEKIPDGWEDNDAYFEQQIKEKCPLLEDSSFVERYPSVVRVAEVLDDLDDLRKINHDELSYFKDLRVSDINDFLNLLEEDSPSAISVYDEVRKIYDFKEDKREPVKIKRKGKLERNLA